MTPKEAIEDFFRTLATRRVKGVLVISIVIYALFMAALGYAWYSPQWSGSFRFFNDAAEWQQMDKLAHFFWAFQASAIALRLFTWARLTDIKSTCIAAMLSFLLVSSIEVFDGFSLNYGASLYDVLANALGCITFLLQNLIWKKIRIWPKFSFHSTVFAPLRPVLLGNGLLEEILKDYNGQTFWYSFQWDKLPFPAWLTLTVGIGAEGMLYSRDNENELMNLSPYRKYLLSFDLNLSHLKTSSKILNSMLYVLNIIKIPAPALEFSPHGIKFHPIYF